MKILVSSFSDKVFVNDLKNNVNIINNFVKEGNMFIISTGKNISKVLSTLANFNLDVSYYICNDGAVIFDKYLNVIYRVDIAPIYVKSFFNIFKKCRYIDYIKIDTSSTLVDNLIGNANKIVMKYNDKKIALKIQELINKKYKGVYAYTTYNYINIVNNSVSKKMALEYMLDFYNLKNHQVYTIVKDNNDKSLKDYESYVINNNNGIFKYNAHNIEEIIKRIK